MRRARQAAPAVVGAGDYALGQIAGDVRAGGRYARRYPAMAAYLTGGGKLALGGALWAAYAHERSAIEAELAGDWPRWRECMARARAAMGVGATPERAA